VIQTLLSALLLAAQHQHTPAHSFEDVDRWVAEFESPERDRQQKPDEVVAALKLRSSDRIADIGAGTGYFTRRFAKSAAGGTVYAVDLEPNMLRYIAKRARTEGQKNVVPVLGLPESPMLPPDSVDVIFICNTIHHIEERSAYYAVLREILAPTSPVTGLSPKLDNLSTSTLDERTCCGGRGPSG
jgi:ubiquinone/menaquinone biosynthesis C-methylase UbiE